MKRAVMADDSNLERRAGLRAERYSQHGNPAFEQRLAHRTAANEGAFFLPFLRAGMRVTGRGLWSWVDQAWTGNVAEDHRLCFLEKDLR